MAEQMNEPMIIFLSIALCIIFIAVPVLMGRNRKQNYKTPRERRIWAAWEQFAHDYKLQLTVKGVFNRTAHVKGIYRDYHVTLFTSRHQKQGDEFKNIDDYFFRTNARLTFTYFERKVFAFPDASSEKGLLQTTEDLLKVLIPSGLSHHSRKNARLFFNDGVICYQYDIFERRRQYLRQLTNMLANMADNMSKVINLGGEVVPILQKIVDDKDTFAPIAIYLLQRIAAQSQSLIPKAGDLLCLDCLLRYASLPIRLPRQFDITYYACPKCHQNRVHFEGEVIAVLDEAMEANQLERDDGLLVNWLAYKTVFDFDAIHIQQATDKVVEQLAAVIGNDTDKRRRTLYKKMRCTIASTCRLTENTRRVLAQVVGTVDVVN